MLGLETDVLIALVGLAYLALRVLYAFSKVIWWYVADSHRVSKLTPYLPFFTGFAVALIAVGLLSMITDWPIAGMRFVPLVAYSVAAGVGFILGIGLDFFLDIYFYSLSNWLMARRVPRYRERLLYGEPEVRLQAAQQLSGLGAYARPARPELLAVLKDESAEVRTAAAVAILGTLSEPPDDDADVPKAARLMLNDPDARVRVYAAAILIAYGAAAEEVLPALCEGLRCKDINASEVAAQALGRLGPAAEPAISALREAVLDRDEPNYAAVETLGKIGAPAVPVLISILERGDSRSKWMAAGELGDLGEPARVALPALRKLSIQPDSMVSITAKKAIKKLGGEIQ